ncbi:MAG TPA: histidinol-phosphate transaminase, partial [Dehalococcoidales bacterium]|nr:histidinol-phosphate transaminase [Dehalococcoidales bacterium]
RLEMSDGIEKLVRIDMSHFGAYSPCKSPEIISRQTGIPEAEIIKLDANENPYGCSPRVSQALARYPYLNIYPDANQTELRECLASYSGLGMEYLVAGNGSDELIDLLLRMFLEPGDEVIVNVPTFDMYRFSTEVCRGRVVNVLRNKRFEVDVAAVKAAVTARTRLIFITSPNNPTGTIISEADILELVKLRLPLVVDEAYYEFSGNTVISLVPEYDNLMVLRTFSKWAGLAGLRVGYGAFPLKIADILMKIKPPYSINMAASLAARISIEEREYLLETVAKMIDERQRMFGKLLKLNFLKPVPSQANFILCEVTRGDAKYLQDELEKRGILVRYYNTPLLRNYIRISAGKPEQTDRIIRALEEIGGK